MARVALVTNYGLSLVSMRGPLIAALRKAGHDVVVCAPPDDPSANASLESVGASFRSLPGDRTGISPVADLDYARRIDAVYEEFQPDRVLAFSSKPVIYSGLVARRRNHAHTYGVLTGLGYVFTGSSLRQRILSVLAGSLYRMALPGMRRVIFQNSDDLNFFVGHRLLGREAQGLVIPGDGVDLEHFEPVPLPGQGRFLQIARLLRDKGVAEYFRAAEIVRAKQPEARFRIVGWFDTNPAAIPEHVVRQWLAAGHVEFQGFSKDVRAQISETDIYVLPSYREGMPRTTIEAMAMGRPIITTDVPGCRDTVEQGVNGWLVPSGSADALAEAMLDALESRERWAAMGGQSRERARTRYSTRVINELLLEAMDCG